MRTYAHLRKPMHTDAQPSIPIHTHPHLYTPIYSHVHARVCAPVHSDSHLCTRYLSTPPTHAFLMGKAAHDYMESNANVGKIVLNVDISDMGSALWSTRCMVEMPTPLSYMQTPWKPFQESTGLFIHRFEYLEPLIWIAHGSTSRSVNTMHKVHAPWELGSWLHTVVLGSWLQLSTKQRCLVLNWSVGQLSTKQQQSKY